MSDGAYSPEKALMHRDRLAVLRRGEQPYPVHVHLILSDLCNLDCPGCCHRISGYPSNQLFNVVREDGSTDHNPNRMLSSAAVRALLDDCVAMGTRACEFTGGGEPTVHPDCVQLLAYAQRLGLRTALVTNGIIRRHGLVETAARCDWLRVSIDAATEETYGRVRPALGGPSGENLRKALATVSAFREEIDRQKTSCAIGTTFVVQRENWHEIYDAARLCRDRGAHYVKICPLFTPERDAYHQDFRAKAETLERQAVMDLDGKDFRVYARYREKIEDLEAPPDYRDCWFQHLTTYVGGDGNVYRCCATSYNERGLIGNIRDGFKALWDSANKQYLYANFDARGCTFCPMNDRNRAIHRAIQSSNLQPAANFQHVDFV